MSRNKKLRSKKAGLPPGSPLAIGERKIHTLLCSRMDFAPGELQENLPLEAPGTTGTRWLNIYGAHSPEDIQTLARDYGLHPLVQEDILNTAQRQKIDAYDDYLYIVLHRYELAPDTLELEQDQISLILGRNFLLSFQERPSKTFEPVRQRLRNPHSSLRRGGAGMLAYSLIDAVVDSYFGVIEQLDEEADGLENELLKHPRPATLERIHQLKQRVSHLRRNLHPLREVLGSLHRDAGDFFGDAVQLYLRDVYDHTVHILESLEDLRDQATGLLDVYLSTVSQRVNLEVRTLTVVATIFMPATLIAGVFGMNFHRMPWLELESGFTYAMLLMLAIACLMLLIFWRRRFF